MELTVGKEADLKPGQMCSLAIGQGKYVLVFRDGEGGLHALEDKCSHAEVRLSGGKFSGFEVECPAHGARFDVRSGKALCMPAVAPVKSYPVKVVAGNIIVLVE